MKLFKYTVAIPILFEGEGGQPSTTFQVGAKAGDAEVLEIEATPVGVVVRRAGELRRDVLLTGTGSGQLLAKNSPKPAQGKP